MSKRPQRTRGPKRWLLGGLILVGGMGVAVWWALRFERKAGEVKEVKAEHPPEHAGGGDASSTPLGQNGGLLPVTANQEPRGLAAKDEQPGLHSSTGNAFPWDGVTVLTNAQGQTLTWTVQRVAGEVWITGTHPHWSVEHHARPDGTPLTTVKKTGASITRVIYSAEGATLEHSDGHGNNSHLTVQEKGLWDGATLDARLAGLAWGRGKKARMRILDVDLADGSTYPMVAEYAGEEGCGPVPCHHVHLALDDFRRVFAPTFEYRYAIAPGARYLQHDGGGLQFVAR